MTEQINQPSWDMLAAVDEQICSALHKIDSLHESGVSAHLLANIDRQLKSVRDLLSLRNAPDSAYGDSDTIVAEMLDLASEFEGEARAHVAMGDRAESAKCQRAAYALRKLASLPAPSQAEPVGWCAYHKTHGWRPDLAAKDQQAATAAAMRSIESAGQQGWEIQPLYPFSVETATMSEALQKAVSFARQVATMDDMRDAPGCAAIARKYQAIFESALCLHAVPSENAVERDEIVFLRKVDAGTDNACWVVANRVDPDAVAFVMDAAAATRRRSGPRTMDILGRNAVAQVLLDFDYHNCNSLEIADIVLENFEVVWPPRPPGDSDDVRRSSIEECARHLERSYPDHAWLNAACAAIRCLGATSRPNGNPAVSTLPASNFTPGDPVEIRKVENEIDEIVIRRGDVHIEQMSADSWYMGIDASDGSYWQFWFGAKNRKSHVEFSHVEHHHPAVAGFAKPASRRYSVSPNAKTEHAGD